MRLILPLAILFFVALGCSSSSKAPQAERSIGNGQDQSGRLTDDGKKFLGAALGYLTSMQSQNTKLATVMSKAPAKATLGEIKSQIERAQSVENAAYAGDYKPKACPPDFSNTCQEIDDLHNGYNAAFDEYLEYWNDQNLSHITSASERYKAVVKQSNDVVKSLTRRMDTIKK